MGNITKSKAQQLEFALAAVQLQQSEFWDALAQLEILIGFDLDSTVNFSEWTIAELRRANKK